MLVIITSLLLLCGHQVHSFGFETFFLEVPVDHFSFSINDTFKLRYLLNDTFWSDGGPIFFYTGNEGDITLFAQNSGFLFEIAKQFKAVLVFAEHRYYGNSLPYGNMSYSSAKYLGYLTAQQALADYVDVIQKLQKSPLGALGPLPVITFGGSYGGMLASWFRMKYPATVLGAIASSAPIWQFSGITPCENFNRITTEVYAMSSDDDCSIPIKKSWKAIRSVTSTAEGMLWLSKNWTLCRNITTQEDVDQTLSFLSDIITNMAMVNYPYATNFLAPLPPNPVKAFCAHLHGHSGYDGDEKTLLFNIGKAIGVYTNYTKNSTCNDILASYDSSLGTNGWDFQACTEMIMPMCSKDDDMFETEAWDFDKYAEDCFIKWGVKPQNKYLPILEYGGTNIKYASNIVFSNGLLDPWSSGGVLSNITSSVSAIVIPEGAHHIDLRASNKDDPQSVIHARQYHVNMIKTWLVEFSKTNTTLQRYEGEIILI